MWHIGRGHRCHILPRFQCVASTGQQPPGRDPKQAFGLAVRRRRTQIGLSQESLADMASVERAYVSALERGKRNPTLLTQTRIAAALGVQLQQLIADAEGIE
jgi:ribosome-binding protein aMBF1 (putative translation factor)